MSRVWTDDIAGFKDIVDATGDEELPLPRRPTLKISGSAVVTDRPAENLTEVEIDVDLSDVSADIAAAQADATQALSDAASAQADATQALADAASALAAATGAASDAADAQTDATQALADAAAALTAASGASGAASDAQDSADAAQADVDLVKLLFDWNGTDTSQFDATSALRTNMTSSDASFLSVVADANSPHGNVLRVSATSNTASPYGHCIRLITTTFPLRYRIEMDVKPVTETGQGYWGFAVMATDNAGTLSAYAIIGGEAANSKYRVDAGTPTAIESTRGGPWGNSSTTQNIVLTVFGVKRSGVPPKFYFRCDSWAGATRDENAAQQSDWGSEPATALTNLASNRIGLVFRANANPTTLTLDIMSLRVYAI